MNRQQRRAAAAYKRKWTSGEWRQGTMMGTMIYTQTIGVLHPHGYFYYWFECPANFSPEDGIPPDTIMHGPFKTKAEASENERLVLLGPQCEITEGGMWDPAWSKPQ